MIMLSLPAIPPALPPFLFKGADGIRDAASQAIANVISRDTAGANDGAITQEFDEAKRAEIAKGFEAAKTLTEQTAVFFNNRAADQKEEEKKLEQLGSRDANGQWQPKAGLTTEQLDAFYKAKVKYTDLQTNFGATSPARMIATALTGAAGSNVAGNLTGLVQGAVVNVLQGLAVNQVKHIADSLLDGQGNPTASSEAVRAALQGLTACAGAVANGSGNCTSAAAGASASVVLNYLLTEFVDPQPKDANGNPIERTLEDQQARNNLVATLIGAIAAGAGIDPGSATNAAQVETENNDQAQSEQGRVPICNPAVGEDCKDAPGFRAYATGEYGLNALTLWKSAERLAQEQLGTNDVAAVEALVAWNVASNDEISLDELAGLYVLKGGQQGLNDFMKGRNFTDLRNQIDQFETQGLQLLMRVDTKQLGEYARDPSKIDELAKTNPTAAQNVRTVLSYIEYAAVRENAAASGATTAKLALGAKAYLAAITDPQNLSLENAGNLLKGAAQSVVSGVITAGDAVVHVNNPLAGNNVVTDLANGALGDSGDVHNLFGECDTIACTAARGTGEVASIFIPFKFLPKGAGAADNAAGTVAGGADDAVKAPNPPAPLKDLLDNGDDFVDAPGISIPYGYPINLQGKALEDALDATGKLGRRLGDSSKTFDFFDPANGTATSAKSLNTLTDPKLKNPAGITQALDKYVNDIIHYVPRQSFTIDLPESLIISKAIVVAVPKGTNAAQMAAIAKSVDTARLNGIKIKIIVTGS